ncbi:hypothetical protein EJ08DRAFT_699939 [Tothia fuscella]|uniref:Uncharacterized protein n=1 Tax=Tothia fuscella TaxID=1048955 RepID=A0A9P4NLT5_9PEZI|nr:hypothetical protein EJ08DRAFT_699939 [Tothia fuscella]
MYTPLRTRKSLPATLEIVVDLKTSDIHQLRDLVGQLWMMPSFSVLEKKVYVYLRGQNENVARIKQELGAPFNIKVMDSANSEDSPYFTHIATHWDRLATHTMFISSDLADITLVKARIIDYFSINTGVLPLGPVENYSSEEDLENLDCSLNGRPFKDNMAHAPNGHVIVSAKRIRSRPVELCQYAQRSNAQHTQDSAPSKTSKRPWRASGQSPMKADEPRQDGKKSISTGDLILWGCEDDKLVKTCGGIDAWMRRRTIYDADDRCQCLDRSTKLTKSARRFQG